jgi:phosphatidate cytidylyltransferase
MLGKRVLVAVLLLPILIWAIMANGIPYLLLFLFLLGMAVWEYGSLFWAGGYQPHKIWMVLSTGGLLYARFLAEFKYDWILIPIIILVALVLHIIEYEKGRDLAATDFAITLSGIFYIGILGSLLFMIRTLPAGEWWLLVVLPGVWLADSGAYFIGSKFGKHKIAPRLSPNKSWQGYFGGILMAVIFTPLLISWYTTIGAPADAGLTLKAGIILGLLLGILPTLGDLGESMIKRQVGQKDSGTLLPGHGGIFDRIDSWLWAGAIGYFVILNFLI